MIGTVTLYYNDQVICSLNFTSRGQRKALMSQMLRLYPVANITGRVYFQIQLGQEDYIGFFKNRPDAVDDVLKMYEAGVPLKFIYEKYGENQSLAIYDILRKNNVEMRNKKHKVIWEPLD